MHLAIAIFGSYGDHFPAWQVGQEAVRRGHRVSLIGSERYLRQFDDSGMEYHFVLSMEEFQAREARIANGGFSQRMAVFREAAEMQLRRTYAVLQQLHLHTNDVILTQPGPPSRPALMLREQSAVPVMALIIDPFHTLEVPGSWWERCKLWLLRRGLRNLTLEEFNRFREECGLSAVNDPDQWETAQIDAACGLYPEFLARSLPNRNMSYPLRLTGYTVTEVAPQAPPAEIEAFLAEGSPPVVVSKPSWLSRSEEFFRETAGALQQIGMRGLFTGTVPSASYSREILCIPFANHQDFLPRARAFIHHGGAGTTGAGIYAGAPQLIVPQVPMQSDVGHRLQRLGVGDVLLLRHYHGARIHDAIKRLTTSPTVANRCRELAQELHQPGPKSTELICDEAEALARRGLRAH